NSEGAENGRLCDAPCAKTAVAHESNSPFICRDDRRRSKNLADRASRLRDSQNTVGRLEPIVTTQTDLMASRVGKSSNVHGRGKRTQPPRDRETRDSSVLVL